MNLFIGTSGFSYNEWKGKFYPEKFSNKKMLSFYAEHFSAVEINNTFYRMPSKSTLELWAGEVPENFKFILKAPGEITHKKKLNDCEEQIKYFISASEALGNKRGPFLIQLPPYLRKDTDRLKNFITNIPESVLAAFEFRHQSWFDEEVYKILRERNFAFCLADTDETPVKEIISTASWSYLRLRKSDYNKKELSDWAKKISSQEWKDAFIFLKHEDEAKGPDFAKKLIESFNKS